MSGTVFEIADEIRHLSSDEIEELYQRYLDGEKNSALVKDYKIDINPNKLIKIFPPKNLKDTLCPYCEIPMFTKRSSKSQSSWNVPPIECYECDHKIFSQEYPYNRQICNCEQCVRIARQEKIEAEKKRRELIQEKYCLDDKEPIEYSELNFFNKLVLLTLFRMQTDEDFDYILSLDDPSRTESLSPTEQMDIECLKELFRAGVVAIDPESRIEAFVEEEDFNSFDLTRTRWIPNITLDGLERANLKKIYREIYQELEDGIQSHWKNDIHETLFRIAREEVLQYVYVRTNELKVNFAAENKTREVVDQLLQNFSVSEIYYFVKKAVEDAHIYYSRGLAISKKQAANTIPNKMLSLGERAINEGWNTYKYSRDTRAPRSYLSKIFYDFFLRDEDSGFHKAPGKHWSQELYPRNFCDNKGSEENSLHCYQCESRNIEVKMTVVGLEIICKDCGSVNEFIPSK